MGATDATLTDSPRQRVDPRAGPLHRLPFWSRLGEHGDQAIVLIAGDQCLPRRRQQSLVSPASMVNAKPDVGGPKGQLLDAGFVPPRTAGVLTLGAMAALLARPWRRHASLVEVIRNPAQGVTREESGHDFPNDCGLFRVLDVVVADDSAILVVLLFAGPSI